MTTTFRCSKRFIVLAVFAALAVPGRAEDAELQAVADAAAAAQIEVLKAQVRTLRALAAQDPFIKATQVAQELGVQPAHLGQCWATAAAERRNRGWTRAATSGGIGITLLVVFAVACRRLCRLMKIVSGPTNVRPAWYRSTNSPAFVTTLSVLLLVGVAAVITGSVLCVVAVCGLEDAAAPSLGFFEYLLEQSK